MSTSVEIITARKVPLGGPRAMTVHRTLPQRQRSMIGAWCFIDHFGPDDVAATGGMDVAPHPHTGLQTVSWLFDGAITHHDSGDNHAVVRPGEVNLMTAGAGICHSEVSTQDTRSLHGVQLWTALPEAARFGPRRFDHFTPSPHPVGDGQALVFIGELAGASSPIPTFSPLVGAELRLPPGGAMTFDLNPDFEHGLLVDAGEVELAGTPVAPRELGYLGLGEDSATVTNTGTTPARLLIIGGEPLRENIVMWWNFLGRSHEEIAHFRQLWEDHSETFGKTDDYIGHDRQGLSRLPAPALPNARIRPRINAPLFARAELNPGADAVSPAYDPRGKNAGKDRS